MAMAAAEIERFIKEALPDASIEIRDLAGDGNHYAATVMSAAFKGKSRVQQHQMVYASLKGRMGGELHALATAKGFRPLADDGIRRVLAGDTSLEEIARVVDLTERAIGVAT